MIQGPGQIIEDQINNIIQQQFHRIEKDISYKKPLKEIDEEKVPAPLRLEEGKRRHYHENLWLFLYDPITKVFGTLIGHGMTQAGQFQRTGLSQPVENLNTLALHSQMRRLQEHKTLFRKTSNDICY